MGKVYFCAEMLGYASPLAYNPASHLSLHSICAQAIYVDRESKAPRSKSDGRTLTRAASKPGQIYADAILRQSDAIGKTQAILSPQ